MIIKSIPKIQVALIQLETSIRLFNRRNYVCAITLAGAAEEIIGQLSKKGGCDCMADYLVRLEKVIRETQSKNVKREVKTFNRIRNSLKHLFKEGDDDPVKCNFKYEAEHMIDRAMINLHVLTKFASSTLNGDPCLKNIVFDKWNRRRLSKDYYNAVYGNEPEVLEEESLSLDPLVELGHLPNKKKYSSASADRPR